MILIGSEGQSVAQIVLQQVGNNIRRGIGGLLDRDGIGQLRIQNRNHRLHDRVDEAILSAQGLVGDYGGAVQLRRGGGNRHYGDDRDGFLNYRLTQGEIPGVAVIQGAYADEFGFVHSGASAQRDNHIRLFLFAKGNGRGGVLGGWIALHAEMVQKLHARFLTAVGHLIEKADLFHKILVVGHQKSLFTVSGRLAAYLFHLSDTENNFRGNGKLKGC